MSRPLSAHEGLAMFEKGRIKVLQEERVGIQKKTFTKWVNSFTNKVGLHVNDLFTDLADGKILLKLLEIISGEKIGRPNVGKLRVQKVENLNKSLSYLATKVRLESIGAEDIVDGNQRLILGLIWTIILRFQIQNIVIKVDEDGPGSEKTSAKEALLLWCQRKTAGYPHVKIDNFTGSWRDGMGFNALIHSHRPDLINYDALHPSRPLQNLNYAFNVADQELGINKLLDAEDICVDKPDEKSVMTYVSSYYHYFAKMKTENIGGKRVAKTLSTLMDIEAMKSQYAVDVEKLLTWIRRKTHELQDHRFPNSLEGIQQEMQVFKEYRLVEKPPKYTERGNIEALLFTIQAKHKANSLRMFLPAEGLLVHDIERAWLALEKAEHGREVALREELIRLGRLEQLAQKFNRKADLRDQWLTDMQQIVDAHTLGTQTQQVEAALKKHEAISADVLSRKDRFVLLSNISRELMNGNYHKKDEVKEREQDIIRRWKSLIENLHKKKQTLLGFCELMVMFREIETLLAELKDIESPVSSEEYGKHLLAVEDLLQKQSLLDAQVQNQGRRVTGLNQRADEIIKSRHPSSDILSDRIGQLNKEYDKVSRLSNERKRMLAAWQRYFQFLQDGEEEVAWLTDTQRLIRSADTGKDLNAVLRQIKQHEALEEEMDARWLHCEKVCDVGEALVAAGHEDSDNVQRHLDAMNDNWKLLRELCRKRKAHLDDAAEAQQYYADANEAESWMRTMMPLVSSQETGKDESSADALLRRHNNLVQEIDTYRDDIQRLDQLAACMTKDSKLHGLDAPRSEEISPAKLSLPAEETAVQDLVPQVQVNYPYSGKSIQVTRGEVADLLDKSNPEWWKVRRENGQTGYVPANYVKELPPRQQPAAGPTHQAGDKNRRRQDRRTPSLRSGDNLHYDKENVEQRQAAISDKYKTLVQLAQKRKRVLEDAVQLFKYYRDCDEFEQWMKDREQLLQGGETLSENALIMKRKYQNFLTDLLANKDRYNKLNASAQTIIDSGHPDKRAVQRRQAEINDRWDHLNRLKIEREKTLEGASSVELFQKTCDEVKDWMLEKLDALDTNDLGKDISSVEALLRKHQNLERELEPLADKLNKVNMLATAVKSSYPGEALYVNQRQKELDDMWKALQDKAAERKAKLKQAKDRHQFAQEAKDLASSLHALRDALSNQQLPRSVKQAEELLQDHVDTKQELQANQDRIDKLQALADKLAAAGDPSAADVMKQVKALQAEQDALQATWNDRQKQLQSALQLQQFIKEADQIDSVTSSHAAFLEVDSRGDSVDGVETLLKRQDDFTNTLVAQDERLNAFSDLADRLLKDKHPDSAVIKKRRDSVLKRRDDVKAKNKDRLVALRDALAFHQFKRDADELCEWIDDKAKTAADESYRDLTNLQAKLKKHQAFQAELKANEQRLMDLNKNGEDLIRARHYASDKIDKILGDVNQKWNALFTESASKADKLQQANQQHSYNQTVQDVQDKMRDLEKAARAPELGNDLHGVKDLLKKQQDLENELAAEKARIAALRALGEQLAREGHFDAAAILAKADELEARYHHLAPLVAEKRKKLEDSQRWHQYNFDVDGEMQWIKEHLPAASSSDYGRTLVDAKNLSTKHQNLEQEMSNHEPQIERVLARGKQLLDQQHFASDEIRQKVGNLSNDWSDLMLKMNVRKTNLDLSLQTQQYLSDAGEVATWLAEKQQLVSSTDYGKDQDATEKLLTKHKALETDIVTYANIVDNLGKKARSLCAAKHQKPNQAKVIQERQSKLQDLLSQLERSSADRRKQLDHSRDFYDYMREADDVKEMLKDQMNTASSEDYGQDFEHLLDIQKKVDEFKLNVDAGSERYHKLDKLADELIKKPDNPHVPIIAEKQEELRTSFDMLLEQIEARDQKLDGAGEIHRFNRDVEDISSRIQEKYDSIPDDVGKDIKATESYQKKHEAFQNDLVALEAQLQVLVDDSARLQASYPGGNAEQIEQQEASVLHNWEALQQRSMQRKADLQEASALYRFNAQVRDLLHWSSALRQTMKTKEAARDCTAVKTLLDAHQQLKAQIDARDADFNALQQRGRKMIEDGHFASTEVKDKVRQLETEHDNLRSAWREKQNYLDDLMEAQQFYRDANQLNTLSTTQEAYLQSVEMGTSVDQVEGLLKKHDNFQKLLLTQRDKLGLVEKQASKLSAQNHCDREKIQQVARDVRQRRDNIERMSAERADKLQQNLLYTQFSRHTAEMDQWLDEKLKLVRESSDEVSADLHGKVSQLQKHQAFEAEVMANVPRIENAKKQAGVLLAPPAHPNGRDIEQRVSQLCRKWDSLLEASARRAKLLEEAKDIVKFNQEVDAVESWIRDKVTMISAGDLGEDYEHCLELQKKVSDIGSGVTVDEPRIQAINALAQQLITQGQLDPQTVKGRRDVLNKNWQNLQGSLHNYKQKLAEALEVHKFNRDVDDLNQRINEKALLMSTDDCGRDLPGVEALQRKQEGVARDMTALQHQLEKMEAAANVLSKTYPQMKPGIIDKQKEMLDNWEKLEDLCDLRKNKLEQSYQLQKFLADAKELLTWSSNTITQMTNGSLARDVHEAEALLDIHQEQKAEIDGRQENFQSVSDHGKNLVNNKHYASKVIQQMLSVLRETRSKLLEAWQTRYTRLVQCRQLQTFKEQVELAESWLASKDAFLANEDLGHNLSTVEALMKKHLAFEKTMKAQETRLTSLSQFSRQLIGQDHYAEKEIRACLDMVLERKRDLDEMTARRRQRLDDSKRYQKFLSNVYEVTRWINDKLPVALDQNYRDPSNLQGKQQKHAAFEAEIHANKAAIQQIEQEADGLVADKHYATSDIKRRVDDVHLQWQALISACSEKKERLNDAYRGLLFNRSLDELESWMDDVETSLSSEDHGTNLTSVNNLLKRHQLLEQDLVSHQEKVKEAVATAELFYKERHFMNNDIQHRVKKIVERYNGLGEPCHIRRDNLEDALTMYQFYRDVDDELMWIKEKTPSAQSNELGDSLTSVQYLQKKHFALESEIVSHEVLTEGVANAAQHMVSNKHFASADINARLENLLFQLKRLKDTAAERRQKLTDALKSQLYYNEVNEAESWIDEQKTILTGSDLGRDEDSVQCLLKKLDALDLDIEGFKHTINRLADICKDLSDNGHFDKDNVRRYQFRLEKSYKELLESAQKRRLTLLENKNLFEYYRDADEVEIWLKERQLVAANDDYGQDLDHVMILQQKFEYFLHKLFVSEERVNVIDDICQQLVAGGHFQATAIKKRCADIHQLWTEVKELSEARKEALESAKQVHAFVRDADDTLAWISEKDLQTGSDDYGHDLESVIALDRKHGVFQRDLAAIGDQVAALGRQSDSLCRSYPDARLNITDKMEEVESSWRHLQEKSDSRRDKLKQALDLQQYFSDYSELLAWCMEMMALITADELSRDVTGAEALVTRNKEHKAEIEAMHDSFANFFNTGGQLVNQKHFLSKEIQQKINHLSHTRDVLLETLEQRRIIYAQHLDLMLLFHEIEQLEVWLTFRENILDQAQMGNSINEVEDLLRKHDDFEKAIQAVEERFNALRRKTKLEEEFVTLKLREGENRVDERKRQDDVEKMELKRKEQERILQERKREDEKRKAQEIIKQRTPRRKTDEAIIPEHLLQTRRGSQPRATEAAQVAPVAPVDRQLSDGVVTNLIGRSGGVKRTPSVRPTGVDRTVSSEPRSLSPVSPVSPVRSPVAIAEHQAGTKLVPATTPDYDDFIVLPSLSSPEEITISPRTITVKAPVNINIVPVHVAPSSALKSPVRSSPTSPTFAKPPLPTTLLAPPEKAGAAVASSDFLKPEDATDSAKYKRSSKPKRAISFSTRRNTETLKEKFKLISELPPAMIEGWLERKHELQSGGKKATIRSWKSYYCTLNNEFLCFFKDKEALCESHAAAAYITVHNAGCEEASDYTKKKNVFRVRLNDAAEYLFEAHNQEEMFSWIDKVSYAAARGFSLRRRASSPSADVSTPHSLVYVPAVTVPGAGDFPPPAALSAASGHEQRDASNGAVSAARPAPLSATRGDKKKHGKKSTDDTSSGISCGEEPDIKSSDPRKTQSSLETRPDNSAPGLAATVNGRASPTAYPVKPPKPKLMAKPKITMGLPYPVTASPPILTPDPLPEFPREPLIPEPTKNTPDAESFAPFSLVESSSPEPVPRKREHRRKDIIPEMVSAAPQEPIFAQSTEFVLDLPEPFDFPELSEMALCEPLTSDFFEPPPPLSPLAAPRTNGFTVWGGVTPTGSAPLTHQNGWNNSPILPKPQSPLVTRLKMESMELPPPPPPIQSSPPSSPKSPISPISPILTTFGQPALLSDAMEPAVSQNYVNTDLYREQIEIQLRARPEPAANDARFSVASTSPASSPPTMRRASKGPPPVPPPRKSSMENSPTLRRRRTPTTTSQCSHAHSADHRHHQQTTTPAHNSSYTSDQSDEETELVAQFRSLPAEVATELGFGPDLDMSQDVDFAHGDLDPYDDLDLYDDLQVDSGDDDSGDWSDDD